MNLKDELILRIPGLKIVENFSYSARTTVGIGGCAELAVSPANVSQMRKLVLFLQSNGIPYHIVGCGSNVLASDCPIKGVTIDTLSCSSVGIDGNIAVCECGCKISAILDYLQGKGLGGLSFMEGIPATVGGAIVMNAGARGDFIGSRVASVCAVENGNMKYFTNKECKFAYKSTRFQNNNSAVLSVSLRCDQASPQEIALERKKIRLSRSMLPKGKNLGCIFKNPSGLSAGQLIDECGLKGLKVGGAIVSEQHANFILNSDRATAEDFCKLIELIKPRVYQSKGILLDEEIRYIGEV